jgi:hypothetical protein
LKVLLFLSWSKLTRYGLLIGEFIHLRRSNKEGSGENKYQFAYSPHPALNSTKEPSLTLGGFSLL